MPRPRPRETNDEFIQRCMGDSEMLSEFPEAETYYDENNTEACGTISYLLWGGKAGLSWSRKKLRELDLLNE